MELVLVHKIIVILINAIAIWLGFWIYFANRKSKVNQIFLFISLLLVLWITSAFVCQYIAKEETLALFFSRLGYSAASLFMIPVYFLIKFFPKEEKEYSILDKFIIGSGIYLFLSSFSNFVIPGVQRIPQGYFPAFGRGIFISWMILSLLTVFVISRFFQKYFKSTKEERIRFQYLLIGFVIYLVMNVIFNIVSPLLEGAHTYHYIGEYSAIFLLGFTAYAVIKQELFGVKVILTQLLVAVMGIVLLVLPFLVPIFWLKILLLSIFLLFCIFGYLLIKSTLREVRQKEILEQRVKQRTKELEKRTLELEKAKKALEGAKGILEIKVRARTKELQELNETLEEKVKLRTKELQERVDELSRWYKLTIGRELKMVELKKEMKRLKKEKEE